MTVKLAVAWRPCAPVTTHGVLARRDRRQPGEEHVALVDGVVEGALLVHDGPVPGYPHAEQPDPHLGLRDEPAAVHDEHRVAVTARLPHRQLRRAARVVGSVDGGKPPGLNGVPGAVLPAVADGFAPTGLRPAPAGRPAGTLPRRSPPRRRAARPRRRPARPRCRSGPAAAPGPGGRPLSVRRRRLAGGPAAPAAGFRRACRERGVGPECGVLALLLVPAVRPRRAAARPGCAGSHRSARSPRRSGRSGRRRARPGCRRTARAAASSAAEVGRLRGQRSRQAVTMLARSAGRPSRSGGSVASRTRTSITVSPS